MEQQDSRDNGLGHALGGSPAQVIWMKREFETIGHEKE